MLGPPGRRLRARVRALLRRGPAADELQRRYLNLLERAVTHTLYHPPDTRLPPEHVRRSFKEVFEEEGIELLPGPERTRRLRKEGRDWPVYAPTMVGLERLRNVRRLTESVLAEGVAGDLIEAGCWRGGVAIMMRGILAAHGDPGRTVWLADSFRGLPKPDPARYPADAQDLGYTDEELAVPRPEVEGNFRRFGLLDERVRFVEGLFKDTLPTLSEQRWALVRLDGDLYESTMDGLRNLYPQLSRGGYLIIDDYGFDNCRAAVEDYRREHSIDEPIERVDWTGAFWRKRA